MNMIVDNGEVGVGAKYASRTVNEAEVIKLKSGNGTAKVNFLSV